VLVVDDDAVVASVLRLALEREGHEVRVAANVPEALELFTPAAIDVVLTDLVMPGASGLDLLKALESQDPFVPVIIITADDSVHSAAEAVRERAFDYLTKPVPRQQLADAVGRALTYRRESQERARDHERRVRDQERLAQEHRQLTIRHQHTHKLLSNLLNRVNEGIIVFDAQGRIVDTSESFVALLGLPLHDLLDRDAREYFAPDPTEGDIQTRIAELAASPSRDAYWRGEVTVRGSRERLIPARLSLARVEIALGDEEGHTLYVVGLLSYDAAHEELSRQLQQADRLATVGILAGSAAHEIRNDLGPLLGYLTLIETGGSSANDLVPLMRDSIRRVRQHVDEILEPFRPRVKARGAIAMRDALDGVLGLLRRAGRLRRLTLEIEAPDDDVVVHADRDEFHQIAMNLLINAVDALGDGDGAARGTVRLRLHEAPPFGVFEVSDTGSGIPPEVRARVFEPFFTTKGRGGTGLGLPVVRDIVRSLRGDVTLDSVVGEGTFVRVRLPLYQPEQRQD
jgi:PAS domain S-box-containing protein